MIALTLLLIAVLAQEPTPAPEPPKEPAAPQKLLFSGKPLVVAPFACTEENVQALGLGCSEAEPCPVLLELAQVESAGTGKLLLTGNLHGSSVTYSSILLLSDDDGASWWEPHERLPQTVLDSAQFPDFSTGYVAGHAFATLPRDPFFLVTTDGGKTWRKRPMFDESRVAAIETFAFDNRSEGALILDRTRGGEPGVKYELYETKTGADTWMLREATSRPLKLKRPRTPSADLRLRADARTNSYRVERLTGQRWTLVASFAIKLPECKLTDRELAPPPPEPEPPSVPAPSSAKPAKPPTLRKKP